jgi:hypothetical protein
VPSIPTRLYFFCSFWRKFLAYIFVYVSVSALSPTLWHRKVPIHTFSFNCPRSLIVPGSAALYSYHRRRDPSRDILSVARVQLPVLSLFSVSSRLLAATSTCTVTTFARAWSPPFKAQGIGASHRCPCTCYATLILFTIRANFILITTRNRSPLVARSSFLAWRTTTALYK